MQYNDDEEGDESEPELEDGEIANAPMQLVGSASELYHVLDPLFGKRNADQQ